MKVFVKISEHKSWSTARVSPLIDWIKQSFTWIMRLGCVLIILPDNLTFKALLWRVTRARIKTQHSVFVTRALMINSPISLGREDWTGVDQGCCCWIWITGKKLRVIFYQIWTANQSVRCDHVRVYLSLSEMFLLAWSWFWIRTCLDWSTNHHIHYSEITGKYIITLWNLRDDDHFSHISFLHIITQKEKSTTVKISKLILINVHLNVVNSMYSPGCLQVENWFCCILIEWLV